jgi:hypothetical protein
MPAGDSPATLSVALGVDASLSAEADHRDMEPRTYLRLEGVAVFVGALAVYFALGGPWWLLVVLALAPDLAMVGYLAGPTVGALSYNTAHSSDSISSR